MKSYVLIGDSTQTEVHGGQAKDLMAHKIPQMIDVSIKLFAAPGQMMSCLPGNGYIAGTGSYQQTAMNFFHGAFGQGGGGVLIGLGGNDALVPIPLEQFSAHYRHFLYGIADLPAMGEIVCISPIWLNTRESREIQRYRDEIERLAGDFDHHFIDGLKLVPHSPDHYHGYHLTVAGHAAMTSALMAEMSRFGLW